MRTPRVDDIRVNDQNPGLRDYEASALRLLDKLTNGMAVEINESGTALKYKPGIVTGGRRISHDCGGSRGIGYFLEMVLCVCLFAKKAVDVTLTGITNDEAEISVDTFRTVTLPILKRQFGVEEGLSLQIVKRGAAPGAGGEIQLKLPIARELKTIDWTDEGLVKRVRGVAFTLRVSPQTGNRLVDAARGVLNKFLPDVYIFTDHHPGDGREHGKIRGKKSAPGYGLSLVAETTTGCLLGSDVASGRVARRRRRASPRQGVPRRVPRRVLRKGVRRVRRRNARGGRRCRKNSGRRRLRRSWRRFNAGGVRQRASAARAAADGDRSGADIEGAHRAAHTAGGQDASSHQGVLRGHLQHSAGTGERDGVPLHRRRGHQKPLQTSDVNDAARDATTPR